MRHDLLRKMHVKRGVYGVNRHHVKRMLVYHRFDPFDVELIVLDSSSSRFRLRLYHVLNENLISSLALCGIFFRAYSSS